MESEANMIFLLFGGKMLFGAIAKNKKKAKTKNESLRNAGNIICKGISSCNIPDIINNMGCTKNAKNALHKAIRM